ncbi:MAG: WD40 repeat domain-containing protein, partial [Rhodospirillaceae bacterium]|nr:WD40 repeat domain-containing protein [Rhodospirillaceae bacterium]
MTHLFIRTHIVSAFAGLACLIAVPAQAQFDQMRAIERAIDINVEQALIRVPVSISFDTPPEPIQQAVADEEGRYVLLLRGSNQYEIWNVNLGRMERRGQMNDVRIKAGTVSKAGTAILAFEDGRYGVFDAKSREPAMAGARGTAPITLIAWLPNGAGAVLARADGAVEVLEIASRRVRASFKTTSNAAAIAVDRTGGYVALTDAAGNIGVWDTGTGLNVASYKAGAADPVVALFFPRASDRVVAVSAAGSIISAGQRGVSAQSVCQTACQIVSAQIDRAKNALVLFTADNRILTADADKPSRVSTVELKPKTPRHPGAAPALSSAVLAVPLQDSSIELFRAADPAQPGLLLTSTASGWAVIDNDGRFDGPSTIQDQLKWVGENLAVPLTNFSGQYFEPGLLRKWAGAAGKDAYLTKPVSIGEGVALPPKIELAAAPARTA